MKNVQRISVTALHMQPSLTTCLLEKSEDFILKEVPTYFVTSLYQSVQYAAHIKSAALANASCNSKIVPPQLHAIARE